MSAQGDNEPADAGTRRGERDEPGAGDRNLASNVVAMAAEAGLAGRSAHRCERRGDRAQRASDLDPSGLNRNIDNVNGKISDLKKEKDDLEYKRNNAKDDSERRDLESQIKDKKEQIAALEAKVEAWKKQIDSEKSMARDRQDIGERCVANRVVVQKIFASVKSKAQNESDFDAKQYVSKLVDKYTTSEKGHQEAIDLTNRGIDKCKGKR